MALDGTQIVVVLLSVALFILERRGVLGRVHRPLFTAFASLAAALLSLAYFSYVLRGGPRIIDATSYALEARAFAGGHLSWFVRDPEAATMGRFLVRDALASGTHASVIFPPGYPAYLALFGERAVPLAGAILAAALVPLTGLLSSALHRARSDGDRAYRLGATLSVVCGALRYHTSDTMSHGLAATLVTAALVLVLHFGTKPRTSMLVAAGFVLGWLFATRPVSFGALVPVIVWLASRGVERRALPRTALVVGVAMVPGVALFLAHQQAATGQLFASSQTLYYAQADGPNGCFRYGFGEGIGCMNEHGDFVRANLPEGLTPRAALLVTLRRLKMHAGDALNAWPLAIITLGALYAGCRSRRARPVALTVPLFIAAYSPFYFDGNYPGGGARFFADVLPIEHALIALLIVRSRGLSLSPRLAHHVPALALLGFSVFAWPQHRLLQEREGGRPMFERDVLTRATSRGLVFTDSDHGFSLAFDPGKQDVHFSFARYRGDAVDFFAWEAHGRPPAYRYRYFAEGGPRVDPYLPSAPGRVAFASLWPPLTQHGGFVTRSFPSCEGPEQASLSVESESDATIAFDLPDALEAYSITPRLTVGETSQVTLILHDDVRELASWKSGATSRCVSLDWSRPGSRLRSSSRLGLLIKSRGVVTLDALLLSDALSH